MLRTVESRLSNLTGSADVGAYLLGLGAYVYSEANGEAERYVRLHQVIRALACVSTGDREAEILRYAAQIRQVDRVLAALFVAGARERLAATDPNWLHISERTCFEVAVEQGRLADYLSCSGHFPLPASARAGEDLGLTRRQRYRSFREHFLALPEGPTRHGLRLALLSLFERTEDEFVAALELCEGLRARDTRLATMSAARLLLAIERAESTRFHGTHRDLGWQIVAAAGRWGLAEALPHLRRLLAITPPRDRDARVLRASLQQAIERLTLR